MCDYVVLKCIIWTHLRHKCVTEALSVIIIAHTAEEMDVKKKAFASRLLLQYIARHARPTDAVRALNAALGTRYDLARLGNWRRRERPVPGLVAGYLIGLAARKRA